MDKKLVGVDENKNNIAKEEKKIKGIGGFLYLPLIGLILSMVNVFVAINETKVTEVKIFYAVYLFFIAVLLSAFVKGYKITRLLFIVFLVINLAISLDARSLFALIVFFFYFIFSKRVKNTFVKPLSFKKRMIDKFFLSKPNRKKNETYLYKESEEKNESLEKKSLASKDTSSNCRRTKSDNIVRLILVSGFLIIVFSIAYSFFYLPYKKNQNFEQCLKNSEDTLAQKQQEINERIEKLEKEKEIAQAEADQKRAEFIKNNPEPKKVKYENIFEEFKNRKSDPWFKWIDQYDSFLLPTRDFGWKTNGLRKDLEIIQEEKKTNEDVCYKKYR